MNERLFIQLCEIILGIAAFGGIAFILAATWYDLRMIRYRKHTQTFSKTMTGRREPSITVLVYAHDMITTLEACLNSISANRYKNFKIIVADNCSTDGTKKHLEQYKKTHPGISLLAYRTRTATTRSMALQQAYKKVESSQLILVLDGTDIIPHTLLREGAARFVANANLDMLRLRTLLTDGLSIASLSRYLYMLHRNIIDKSFAQFSLSTSHPNWSGVILKSSTFEHKNTTRKITTEYASTLTYSRSSLGTPPSSVDHIRLAVTHPWKKIASLFAVATSVAFIICIVTYFYYTAATLQSNTLLTLSWIIVSLWLLAVVWLDEAYELRTKIDLTLSVPFMYFIFYVQSIILFAVILKRITLLIPIPDMSLDKMRDTIHLELYSTRY